MKKTSLISIIIPVYNSENYISKALDSILAQNYKDIEIILVNDGSTDNSLSVCRRYADDYSNVILVNKMNGGLCSARNEGLKYAKSDYIMFMDNDDEYTRDSFNVIYKTLLETDCDILRFNRRRVQVFENESIKIDVYGSIGVAQKGKVVSYSNEGFFQNYSQMKKSGCFYGIWNAVFRRKLFTTIKFDETIKAGGEDWLVNLQLYDVAKKISFINDALYVYYRRVSHSVSTTYQYNRVEAIIKCATQERLLVINHNVPINQWIESCVFYIANIIKIMMHKESKLTIEDKANILCNASYSRGLDISEISIKNLNIPIISKIYLLLYKYKYLKILIFLSEIILKVRGNT